MAMRPLHPVVLPGSEAGAKGPSEACADRPRVSRIDGMVHTWVHLWIIIYFFLFLNVLTML